MELFIGIMIPFLGTCLGSASVFFMKNELKPLVQKGLLGFASGVMGSGLCVVSADPAMDMSGSMGKFAFVPAAAGFLLGIFFLLAMDRLVPHLHLGETKPEGRKSNLKKTTMLVLAVTLHNFPEGMAVGVVFAGMLADSAQISLAGAMALSVESPYRISGRSHYFSAPEKRTEGGKRKGFSLRGAFRSSRAPGSFAYHTFI